MHPLIQKKLEDLKTQVRNIEFALERVASEKEVLHEINYAQIDLKELKERVEKYNN